MAAQTGRTTSKWVQFLVDDSAGILRAIPVNSINGVGLDYDEKDVTAFQDALRGVLLDRANCQITIAGPLDTSTAAVAPTLSGSHTVLAGIVGNNTPLALDIRIGIRHTWEAGEPVFGITGTSANGFVCKSYKINPDEGTYTAEFAMYAGSAAPEWATAAHT